MNLFTTLEDGAPKIDAPSSHMMSLGLLFIWDAPHGFLLWFWVETREGEYGNHRKNSKKNLEKGKKNLRVKSCKKGGEIFSKCCLYA